jgi:hypothetical protein
MPLYLPGNFHYTFLTVRSVIPMPDHARGEVGYFCDTTKEPAGLFEAVIDKEILWTGSPILKRGSPSPR